MKNLDAVRKHRYFVPMLGVADTIAVSYDVVLAFDLSVDSYLSDLDEMLQRLVADRSAELSCVNLKQGPTEPVICLQLILVSNKITDRA